MITIDLAPQDVAKIRSIASELSAGAEGEVTPSEAVRAILAASAFDLQLPSGTSDLAVFAKATIDLDQLHPEAIRYWVKMIRLKPGAGPYVLSRDAGPGSNPLIADAERRARLASL